MPLPDNVIEEARKSGYSSGYNAGRKKGTADGDVRIRLLDARLREVNADLLRQKEDREERLLVQCVGMCLEHCDGWTIADKKVNSAEQYVKLARAFVCEMIKPS